MIKPIRFVDRGVANNFDTHIEIHKELKLHPVIYKKILKHERLHDRKTGIEDFIHDIKPTLSFKEQFNVLKLMIKHPKMMWQFSPLYPSKKAGLCLDRNLSIIYGAMFFYMALMISLLFMVL